MGTQFTRLIMEQPPLPVLCCPVENNLIPVKERNLGAKAKDWQKLPYVGPYDEFTEKKELRNIANSKETEFLEQYNGGNLRL
ncbi:hypothetical protein M0R45_013852 [Rubus argutus]|uniref:Uncharacterized protein n=1 Tax=Rubus argutus TaxID=59490 RepID=A0AAW1XLR5_RUBAR